MDASLITKSLLVPGSKHLEGYPNGTKVTFHFRTENEMGEILDDTKALGKPMELIIGKQFQLQVWETCIKSMDVGEVAKFVVDKDLVMLYPSTAKMLRNNYFSNKNIVDHSSCCGQRHYQSTGYKDLDALLQQPENLTFSFEILKTEFPGEYEKETWCMNAKEKLDSIPQLHQQGNMLYEENHYKEAIMKYADAIDRLEQLMLEEKPGSEEWKTLNIQKVPLLLNYAQCQLILGEFYKAIESCTNVLQIDSNNEKALFRRGKAHIGAWNPSEAKKDLNRVLELNPKLKIAVNNELQILNKLLQEKDTQERLQFQKIFE